MKSSLTVLALSSVGLAFPSIRERRQETGLVGSVASGVSGLVSNSGANVESLLGSVASSVNPDNLRPEPGYVFQAPGPDDSRGPCPGLNLLANYGYLPRNGLVSASQVIEATARGFNMGADLATVLAVFAVLSDGDLETETWYLGAGPNHVGGLNRHSTVESDASPNKEDYYLGCGDNHHISSRRFAQNVAYATEDPNKEFSYATMAKHYASNSKYSQEYNPYIYYFPFPSIVSVVAFNFYPEFFSNGSYGAGGVANYESISSIIGARYDNATGHFEYVPERWPEQGWYRRDTEYDAVTALVDGFTFIYPNNPVGMPFGQLGTKNFDANTVLCDIYQGLNSITPITLAGQAEEADAGITWALGKLADVGLDMTVLGCPTDTLSANYLYSNSTQVGGPLAPPPAELANSGNNTYYKTYFCESPTTPNCAATC